MPSIFATSLRRGAAITLVGVALAGVPVMAQSQVSKQIAVFTATTENVYNARDPIQIVLRQWSTDAERDKLLAAWNVPNPVTSLRPAEGRGPDDASAGRGRGGRGGRGGAPAEATAHQTPESALAAALGNAPAVGDLWSSESVGYSLSYAVRIPEAEGRERIILITDRRLGGYVNLWKPVGPAPANKYEFSLIELRLNAKGEGEGKISLTGNVVIDTAAKTFALENYDALPVVLRNVRRRAN
jgi:hypothetical protein